MDGVRGRIPTYTGRYKYLLHQIAEKLDNDATRIKELFVDGTVFET